MFKFHFHNIFAMTHYVNISVIDTLIHVGRIKMLHKHTHLPLCVHVVTGGNGLFGASDCLNQCWYIVSWNLRNKLMLNYIANINSLCCWKMLSAKQWPFCSGLDVVTHKNKISTEISLKKNLTASCLTFAPLFQPHFFQVSGKCV